MFKIIKISKRIKYFWNDVQIMQFEIEIRFMQKSNIKIQQ